MNPTLSRRALLFPFIARVLGVFRLGLLTYLSLVGFLLVTPHANAQNIETWTGGGGNNLVFNNANWDTGQFPQTGDSLIFAGVVRLTPTLNSALSITSISFDSSAGAFVLGGTGTYTISTAAGVTNDSTNTETINNAITLGIAQTWYATSGNLVFDGNVNTNGKQLTINGGKDISIGTGVVSGTGRLTKTSTGTLTLSGANTYSGGTTLSAGTLNINNAKALGTGTFTISGGTIDNTTAGAITLSNNNAQAWNGNFSFTGTKDLNLGTGAVTMNASRLITVNGGNLTIGGAISGATFGITKAGTGTLILDGAIGTTTGSVTENASSGVLTLAGNNTYSGGTTLNGGSTLNINSATALGTGAFTINGGTIDNTTAGVITLSNNNAQVWNGNFTFTGTQSLNLGTGAVALGASRTVTVNANNLTVGGVISGTGFGLTKAGNGTLTLSGANIYTGATTVNAGTLLVNGNNSAAIGAVSVNNSGTTLGGTGTIGGAVTVGSGANLLGGTGSTASGALTLANNLTLNSGSIIELALGATSGAHSTLARSGVGTWTFNATQAFTFINLGVVPGTTYNNIITGLASDPGSESNWAITNAGWSGSFSYASGNISLDVVAVPEPSTWIAGALALGAVGWTQRRRFFRALKRT